MVATKNGTIDAFKQLPSYTEYSKVEAKIKSLLSIHFFPENTDMKKRLCYLDPSTFQCHKTDCCNTNGCSNATINRFVPSVAYTIVQFVEAYKHCQRKKEPGKILSDMNRASDYVLSECEAAVYNPIDEFKLICNNCYFEWIRSHSDLNKMGVPNFVRSRESAYDKLDLTESEKGSFKGIDEDIERLIESFVGCYFETFREIIAERPRYFRNGANCELIAMHCMLLQKPVEFVNASPFAYMLQFKINDDYACIENNRLSWQRNEAIEHIKSMKFLLIHMHNSMEFMKREFCGVMGLRRLFLNQKKVLEWAFPRQVNSFLKNCRKQLKENLKHLKYLESHLLSGKNLNENNLDTKINKYLNKGYAVWFAPLTQEPQRADRLR